jgi:hypothetical protein
VRNAIAALLCVTVLTSGCATTRYSLPAPALAPAASVTAAQAAVDRSAVAAFARQLPIGSRIRVSLGIRRTIRGTLINATDRSIVVQPRTRILEPAIEVPLDQIAGIEVETPGNIGKAIAIGVGTGAATALGVFLLILTVVIDD